MEPITQNETLTSFFTDLGINNEFGTLALGQLTKVNSKYLRDLKLNVNTLLAAKNITKKEAMLIAMAVSINERIDVLTNAFAQLAIKEGSNEEEVAEVTACVSLMNVNNVFYRFRHFTKGNEYYEKTPAGLRMNIMMSPVVGKPLFELISLVISAINGCERCVESHEHSVKELGATEPRIYDAVRLGAVIKGLTVLM
ncbi:MAG: alkylhydroperoxidase [Chitinophagia bacterium]|nr:alkylhydroperoxidase [Chitinophagia bacterium]